MGIEDGTEIGSGRRDRVIRIDHFTRGSLIVAEPLVIRLIPALELVDRRRARALAADAWTLSRLRSSRVAGLRRYVEDPRLATSRRYVGLGHGGALISVAAEGVALSSVLSRRGVLSPRAALVVFIQSLEGLADLHASDLAARDHRPARVLVGTAGVLLTDVGLAALNDRPAPGYRAPELWRSSARDLRTASDPPADVYAATCVFVECLQGHPPYRATSLFALAAAHQYAPPPTRWLPVPLAQLVVAGLDRRPDTRWSARTLASAARRIAATEYGVDWEQLGTAELAEMADPLLVAARRTREYGHRAPAGFRSARPLTMPVRPRANVRPSLPAAHPGDGRYRGRADEPTRRETVPHE